jgi:hypothetical protein
MGIDEPRHDPLPAGIDNLYIVSVFQPYVAGQAPGAFDTIALDHNGLIPTRRIPCAINQDAVRDHDGFFVIAAHLTLLLYGQDLPPEPLSDSPPFLLRNDARNIAKRK